MSQSCRSAVMHTIMDGQDNNFNECTYQRLEWGKKSAHISVSPGARRSCPISKTVWFAHIKLSRAFIQNDTPHKTSGN